MAMSPAHRSSARRRARYRLAGAALAVMLLAPLTALLAPTASAAPKREKLEMYTLEGNAGSIAEAVGGSSSPACGRRRRGSVPTPC
jgi:hypothetical protein